MLAEQATGFRLSPRRIGGYFVFHFVDGLPAEWPKSIVSFDLTPKAGYFALAQINQPLAPLFQLSDEGKTLALWVANDREEALPRARVAWNVQCNGSVLLKGEQRLDVPPLDATPVTTVDLSPMLSHAPVVTIELTLSNASGQQISRTRREVYLPAWQPPHYPDQQPDKARVPLLPDAGGDPSKVDWTSAAQLSGWRQVEGGATKRQITACIAHDGRYLYLQLTEAVNGTALPSDDGIWSGEDWELFFAATRGKPYRQLGVNPRGDVLDLPSDATLSPCGARLISERTPEHWRVLCALPLATLLPGGLHSGSVFYGNLYRQAGSGDIYREQLAWSPTFTTSFHQPDKFAELTLE